MTVRTIAIKEAKDQLAKLVRQAAKGASTTITVHGRPLADLVPHVPQPEAVRPPRALPPRVKLTPGPASDAVLEDLRTDR